LAGPIGACPGVDLSALYDDPDGCLLDESITNALDEDLIERDIQAEKQVAPAHRDL
jgi:hypothetical protein